MLRKAECEAELDEIRGQFEAAVAMLSARRDKLIAGAERGAVYFTALLAEYATTHRAEIVKGSRKSADFMHGRISFRKTGERLRVTDKDALRAWLLAQPVESGLYRLRVEPEMRALQEQFKLTGEIPPGTDVEPEHETVTVEASAPETALAKGE
jgi:phage host-nuclease inhibitor protein Gam